ncbi:MAG: hypothetical protein E6J62_18850 [Deltaproteobacteria bacterium]|nr:MAG: hypothetical protein E6J62_18850 [Deltaproteobacteria bacterium]
MKALRAILAAAAALAVLALGAWGGGAFSAARAEAGGPARTHVVQDYPGRAEGGEIRIGDSLIVNGQPMQLSIFYTSDPVERVVEFYAGSFRDKGLVPIATAPGGQTMVMTGAVDPRKAPQLVTAARRAPFPVPEEHRAYLGYSSDDAGARADAGQFVTALAPQQIRDYYRRELLGRGFDERKGGSTPGLLQFAKSNGEAVTVAVQALSEREGAAVFVSQTRGDGR